MNIRQQKYKKNRILGMNMYNAARAAGYSHNTATKAGSRLEIKLPGLNVWLERVGLTDKKLAIFLLEALEANKVVGYLHQYKKGEKGRIEELRPDEAISNEFLEVPDINSRLKAAELIMKAKGQLKDKIDLSGEIKFTQMPTARLGNRIGELLPLELDIGEPDIRATGTIADAGEAPANPN